MSLESFKSLIEVQSLELKVKDHLDKKEENSKRIDFVLSQQDIRRAKLTTANEDITKYKKDLSLMEKELHFLETEIAKAKEHLANASTQNQVDALEKEIKTLSPKAEEIEEASLEIMEKIDSLEIETTEYQNFISGSEESLNELKEEISQENAQEDIEISRYNERINYLLDSCETRFKDSYLKSSEKYLYKKPLSFIAGNSCSICRFQIPGETADQVERATSLEFCPGCRRLLAPLSAKN